MNKKILKDVPNKYPFCIKTDCPVADHCLRPKAMEAITKRDRLVSIVNPCRTTGSEKCEYFRCDEPQRFGKGFMRMQEEMLPRQYATFMDKLQRHFGRNAYFERRRGERLCTPDDVAYIRKVLESLNLQHLDFDEYEEHYVW